MADALVSAVATVALQAFVRAHIMRTTKWVKCCHSIIVMSGTVMCMQYCTDVMS